MPYRAVLPNKLGAGKSNGAVRIWRTVLVADIIIRTSYGV